MCPKSCGVALVSCDLELRQVTRGHRSAVPTRPTAETIFAPWRLCARNAGSCYEPQGQPKSDSASLTIELMVAGALGRRVCGVVNLGLRLGSL